MICCVAPVRSVHTKMAVWCAPGARPGSGTLAAKASRVPSGDQAGGVASPLVGASTSPSGSMRKVAARIVCTVPPSACGGSGVKTRSGKSAWKLSR